jgi:hypothetical protein
VHDGHPDIDAIADFVEGGLLDAAATAEVAAHLAGCAECRETRDALAGVQDLLGDQPAEPMPDDVAVRIDHALSALSTQTPVSSLDAARARRNRRRLVGGGLLAAAAVAAVAVVLPNLSGSSSDSDAQKGAGAQASAAPRPASGSELNGPQSAAGSDSNNKDAPAQTRRPTPTPSRSGDTYTDASLPGQVRELLDGAPETPQSPSQGPSFAQAEKTVTVPPCALPASGSSRALAVDRGTYDQRDAYVVVLPAKDPAEVRVVVVDAVTCSEISLKDITIRR